MLRLISLVFSSMLFLGSAVADELQDIKKGIAGCALIESVIKRVECYDDLSRALDLEPTRKSIQTSSQWSLRIDQSKFKDTKDVYLSVEANDSVRIGPYDIVKPTLWVRCMENTTSIFIVYNHFLGSDGIKIEYRIDRERALEDLWYISTDHNSVGLWRGNTSLPFIRRLLGKSTLLVRLTPFSESPVTVSFTVSGLREEIGQLAAACNWSP